ncbi:MAG: hypothetical protein CME06_03140 [Gemmatimonadetes bacterium]|nr:hypothetical protein [Gemmatimonadota bacterium]
MLRSRYILAIVLLNFLVLGLFRIKENRDMFHTDQEVFLQNSLRFNDASIRLKLFPPMHMASVSSTLHPLMPYLLYPIAGDMRTFYPSAKLINLTFGLLCLLALYLLVAARYGSVPGLLATLLLSVNSIFVVVSTRLSSEPILLLLVVLWLFVSVRCHAPPHARERGGSGKWILAGVISGLAYLSKPTGLLLPCLFVIVCIARMRSVGAKRFVLYVSALLLTIAPLMVSNTRGNNSPFYNINFFHLLSLSGPSAHTAEDLQRRGAWDVAMSIDGKEFVSRLTAHSITFFDDLLRHLSPTSMPQWFSFPIQQATRSAAALIVAMSTLYVFVSRRRDALVLLVLLFSLTYSLCMVPAFSVNPSPRFLLPVILMFSILIGGFSTAFMAGQRWIKLAVCAVALSSIALHTMRDILGNPLEANDESVDYFLDWTWSAEEGARLAFFEHDTWLVEALVQREGRHIMKDSIDNDVCEFPELYRFLQEREVEFLLISSSIFYDGNPVLEEFEPLGNCERRGNPAREIAPYAELVEEGLPECGYLAIYRMAG